MENVKEILDAESYSLRDVVQSSVYLSSMILFNEFNSEYGKYFDKIFSSRAIADVEPMGDALMETSVIAYTDIETSAELPG